MKKRYVFITRSLPESVIEPLKQIAKVQMWPKEDEPVPQDVLIEEARKADALITMISDKIDDHLFAAAPNLQVIANLAVGYDNIDVAAATKRGIAVCNTPDVLTDTTADLTFGLLISTARRLMEAEAFVKEGKWKSWSPLLLAGHDIHHKTIGIVGMGKIGQAVAKRATGFEMKVYYHNRTRKLDAEKELDATYCTFPELLETADYVVCLTPSTPETKHLFDEKAFKKMKQTAIFVNASRGDVVDEEALYEALVNGEIAAAGLDVFKNEPIDEKHPFLSLSNVVALPHIGSASIETRTKMMNLCCHNIISILSNERPKTIVNKEWLHTNC